MMARRVYPMLYERITRNLDEDGQLEIDAILGDETAMRVRDDRRREMVLSLGGEIG
jgi:hypothetical protein